MHNYKFFLLAVLLVPNMLFANEAQDLLMGMSEEKKATAFAFLIQTSGQKCGNVTKTFYQGSDKKGNVFWSAACLNGRSYSVMINNDAQGSSKVLDCKPLKAIAKVDCFKKFK